MKFKVFSQLNYEVLGPTTFIFNIQVVPTASQLILEELLTCGPHIKMEEFTSSAAEARFVKLFVPEKMQFTINYSATVDVFYKMINEQVLGTLAPILKMDADVIPYLFPSRYCQSDKLEKLATKEFGYLTNDFGKAAAINDWIYNNVEYLGGFTTSSTSAQDTLTERVGVCRDFAHLGIALCRALSIPARYFTAYAYNLNPPDFHACFEAYIGGQWIFFDPTKLAPANGMVKIANGRDAADASVASIFGNAYCTAINVGCISADENFKPFFTENTESQKGLSYH